jgi:hypothetical protein
MLLEEFKKKLTSKVLQDNQPYVKVIVCMDVTERG